MKNAEDLTDRELNESNNRLLSLILDKQKNIDGWITFFGVTTIISIITILIYLSL